MLYSCSQAWQEFLSLSACLMHVRVFMCLSVRACVCVCVSVSVCTVCVKLLVAMANNISCLT